MLTAQNKKALKLAAIKAAAQGVEQFLRNVDGVAYTEVIYHGGETSFRIRVTPEGPGLRESFLVKISEMRY